ncbi:MAG: NUDIX hydrolase [Mogibacterium sp.]|nr:NUDIX hydrolase [Mogibacterium sp.]
MIFEEKTLSSEIVYSGPVFDIRKHRVLTPSGESYRDVVEHSGGSIMVAVTDEGKIIVERQYRKALGTAFLELPAGKADPDEDPEVTAVRELAEETGYTASSVKHLVSFYPTCGYSNEHLHIYICRGLVKGETHWDADECIEIMEYDVEELLSSIMKGEIEDSKTIIGILFARQAGEI